MRSIKFPDMFNSASTNVWKSSEYLSATKQNTTLLLQTERGELFSDPFFGLAIKNYLFDQNNAILRDALIDVIYTQLALFIPQVKVKRSDISIVKAKRGQLLCKFSGVSQIDYAVDTYSLVLFDGSDNTNM